MLKKPRKKTKAEEEEEARLAKEQEVPVLPPSPFASLKLDGDEVCQRAHITSLLSLADGPPLSYEAISVDWGVSHVKFIARLGVQPMQAQIIWDIIQQLKANIANVNMSKQECIDSFQSSLLKCTSSSSSPPPAPVEKPPASSLPASPNVTSRRPLSSPKDKERPESRSKKEKEEKEKLERERLLEQQQREVVPDPTLTISQAEAVTLHIAVLLAHFSLYRACFSNAQRNVVHDRQNVLTDTILAMNDDLYDLNNAVEVTTAAVSNNSAHVDGNTLADAAAAAAANNNSSSQHSSSITSSSTNTNTAPSSSQPTSTLSSTVQLTPDSEALLQQKLHDAQLKFQAMLDQQQQVIDEKLRQVEARLGGAAGKPNSAAHKKK